MGLYLQHDQTNFQVGDVIKVHQLISEGGKERTQVFEGLVIKIRGHKGEKSFTVRKISKGIGVEKIYPADSPFVQKIEVVRPGIVRRAKLYFLRSRTGKNAIKVKSRLNTTQEDAKKTNKAPTKSAKAKATAPKTEAPKAKAAVTTKANKAKPSATKPTATKPEPKKAGAAQGTASKKAAQK